MNIFLKTLQTKENNKITKRNLNLDLIRAVAILFVICVHFLLHNGFYEVPIYGVRLEIMVIMRSIFIWCVPLFLLLTGYLNNKKTYSKKYYKGIQKVIYIYIMCSICCFLFKEKRIDVLAFIQQLFSFKAAPYSWYVNMYIGLFLLIPFLNQLYQSMSKEQKHVFMISLIFISILPSFSFIHVFPDYWLNLWPLTYYFTGSYLNEYQNKWSMKKIGIIFTIVLFVSLSSNLILNYGQVYRTSFLTDYFGIETYFLSILCFLFLLKMNLLHVPKGIRFIITCVSKYSFGMYLISFCFDQIAYSKLNSTVVNVGDKLNYFLPVILFVFGGSFCAAAIIEKLYSLCAKRQGDTVVNKRKLIFFGYDLRIGGIENSLIELLKNINYEKYDVTLVLEHVYEEQIKRLPEKVYVKEYHVSSSSNIFFRKLYNLCQQLIFRLKNYHRYDFSCSYATYSIPGSLLARIASQNNSIYVHSNYYYLYDKHNFINFFNMLSISKFKTIFFVSNEAKCDFLKYYPRLESKTIVCNNFIDNQRILELSKQKIDRKKKHKILFTFVGRLDESSKRITRLIYLIKYLKEKKVSVECWIVGDGPDYQKYDRLIKKEKLENYIFLCGAQENPYPYMKQSDYILLTSKYEGFPVVYLESIILGKKIISTIDVSDETISISHRFGYIVSNDDSKINSEVEKIIKNDHLKIEKINFKEINGQKQILLEKVFDNV